MKGKRMLLADMLFSTSLLNVFSRFFEHNKLVILNYTETTLVFPGTFYACGTITI